MSGFTQTTKDIAEHLAERIWEGTRLRVLDRPGMVRMLERELNKYVDEGTLAFRASDIVEHSQASDTGKAV